MKISVRLLFLACVLYVAAACNKDETLESPGKPVITLDSGTGVYKVKVGREFRISPAVENADGAEYLWLMGTEAIGTGATLTYTINEPGSVDITFRVTTPAGKDEKALRIDVERLAPPVISVAVPDNGLKVLAGESHTIAPDVLNGDDATTYEWKLGDEVVGNDRDYVFVRQETGTYVLTLKAVNGDGSDEKSVTVTVFDEFPVEIIFLPPGYGMAATEKGVFSDRSLLLKPVVVNAYDPLYAWSIEGEGVVADTPVYEFVPAAAGEYRLTFTVTSRSGGNVVRTVSETIDIKIYPEEAAGMRSAGAGSSKTGDKVYEYMPAPGQFINDPQSGFSGEASPESARAYAQGRIDYNSQSGDGQKHVSLGGFGGYIVVGFDHSVENRGGYDFSITGNQMAESSEPGIVWVMQDVNGNGEPDDEWYELRGSESGKTETVQDYAVTYYRPAAPGMAVQWTDNRGGSGSVDYMGAFHGQDYYYPSWVSANSYTLYGTRVQEKLYREGTSWIFGNLGWGYADNWGSDRTGSEPGKIYFKISNAVRADGSEAGLKYVDFIKVQTGVNAKAPAIGEASTEVFCFTDENI